MSKKIGSRNISTDALAGLKGFEDVFEDYVASEEYKDLERKERESSKAGEQYELLRFLEQENDRLKNLEIFLSIKISLKKNFSQTEELTLIQMDRKKILNLKILAEITKFESHFQKNMAQLFNSHFS
jgi:hypothetical protein